MVCRPAVKMPATSPASGAGGGSQDDNGPGQLPEPIAQAVLLEHIRAAGVDTAETPSRRLALLTLAGRRNYSTEQVSVGYLLSDIGAAGIIGELLAADGIGGPLLTALTQRLAVMHREGRIDLVKLFGVIMRATGPAEVEGGPAEVEGGQQPGDGNGPAADEEDADGQP